MHDAKISVLNLCSQPYDFLSLIPVIEGAGGVITDWEGNQLKWEASSKSHAPPSMAFLYTLIHKFMILANNIYVRVVVSVSQALT